MTYSPTRKFLMKNLIALWNTLGMFPDVSTRRLIVQTLDAGTEWELAQTIARTAGLPFHVRA